MILDNGITIVHTIDMNTQRITVSIPANVYALLSQQVASGSVSQYISETIHRRLTEETMKNKLDRDAIEEFMKLRRATKKRSTKRILTAIHKGHQMGV